jgi:hypothetical protein
MRGGRLAQARFRPKRDQDSGRREKTSLTSRSPVEMPALAISLTISAAVASISAPPGGCTGPLMRSPSLSNPCRGTASCTVAERRAEWRVAAPAVAAVFALPADALAPAPFERAAAALPGASARRLLAALPAFRVGDPPLRAGACPAELFAFAVAFAARFAVGFVRFAVGFVRFAPGLDAGFVVAFAATGGAGRGASVLTGPLLLAALRAALRRALDR